MSGALARSDTGGDPVGARAAAHNITLRPDVPWMGTVGLRGQRGGRDFGLGFAIPNSNLPSQDSQSEPDRFLGIGVGAWMTFDF